MEERLGFRVVAGIAGLAHLLQVRLCEERGGVSPGELVAVPQGVLQRENLSIEPGRRPLLHADQGVDGGGSFSQRGSVRLVEEGTDD